MQPRHYTLDIPDTYSTKGYHRMTFFEWGFSSNAHTIMCVHGLTRNAHDFDYIARELAFSYRVIAPDIIGRGESEWLEKPEHYNYGTYVLDVLFLIQHLGLKKLDFLGTSMGGLIGMMIAASNPGLIEKLVINDIGPFIPSATLERIGKYVRITPDFASKEEAGKHLRTILAPFGITDEEHWEHIVHYSTKQHKEGNYYLAYDPAIAHVFSAQAKGEPMPDVELWDLWEKITCPVLVLRGAKSDALLPETAKQMHITGPKAKVVEFPKIGHAPALMEKSQIDVVMNWLSEN